MSCWGSFLTRTYGRQKTKNHESSANYKKFLLNSHPKLVKHFGVTRLALFGSIVRDESVSDTDIDMILAFAGPATSKKYFGVQFDLEDELEYPNYYVTEKAMRVESHPFIESRADNGCPRNHR